MAVCRLCKADKQLVRSHILSEFLYKLTYQYHDPKNPKAKRLLIVPPDLDQKLKYPQKGITERLLCKSCEQHLNHCGEAYVASRLVPEMDKQLSPFNRRSRVIKGLDYTSVKLFQMMQLWRASITTSFLGSQIKLSTTIEEDLRGKLLNADPGKETEYLCAITRVPKSLGPIHNAVVPFFSCSYLNYEIYEFIARGHSYMYVLEDQQAHIGQATGFQKTYLTSNGELPILEDRTGSLQQRASVQIDWLQKQKLARSRRSK